ncbi:dockerin type I repeat-containing protein [Ruminococcus sp.]|uniref:dockerin type I repeat-containing protein n=1 Tax=Ruminococcus sp. TaxID=41978 RepID=UPI0025DBA39D|nr:dockerin type I repeat-containing protein [Ruminococcus sp.]
MIFRKLTATVIAALTVVAPVLLNEWNYLESAVAYAEDQSVLPVQMAWIPSDFDSAREFRNTYGATHIEDGVVCIVFELFLEDSEFDVSYFRNRYELKGTNGVKESAVINYYPTENILESAAVYAVAVIAKRPKGEFEIDLIDKYFDPSLLDAGISPSEGHYSFNAIDSRTTVETDIFGWLPDCDPEYKEYFEKYGEVSVRDNFVVFCMSSKAGGFLTWSPTEYSENFKHYSYSLCNYDTSMFNEDDKELHQVVAYQAVKDGYAKIEWEYLPNCTWELNPPFSEDELKDPLIADCVILDDAQTVLLNGQTRVTVTDEEKGELISDKYMESYPFKFHADIIYKAELFSSLNGDVANYTATKNRSILQECYLCPSLSSLAIAFKKADHFKITTEEQPEIIYYDNGAMDLIFKTSKPPLGDLNGDRIFSISDLVLLQRWLLGVSNVKIAGWSLADFNNDNKLDIFDLCVMRNTLIKSIDIPVALSITETGGYEGVHRVWKVYQDNEKFFVYYNDEKNDTDPLTFEITEKEYRMIMSQDYDRIIENYNKSQHEEVWDGFVHNTVLTYKDGSEKKTYADMFDVIYNIEKILNIKFA